MFTTLSRLPRATDTGFTPGTGSIRWLSDAINIALHLFIVASFVGFAVALVAVQLVKSLLFGITPYDPVTSLIAPLSLVVVATIACLFPALRAARVDPMIALRAD